jgi:three-Cys-motif partner protein
MLAASQRYRFDQLFLNDVDPRAIEALSERLGARADIDLRVLDCNEAAIQARTTLEIPRTLGVAVIDPTAFQIRFEAIERMTRDVRVDLLITVMTGFIRRFMQDVAFIQRLDDFFGSRDWQELLARRDVGEAVTYRHLLDAYEGRLRDLGYIHVDDHVRITNSRERTIHHLVFASKHERGAEFFQKISRVRFTGQSRMELN